MIKETVQAVGVTHIVTETGSKTLLGNRQFEIGDSVWTHGDYAFGTERVCTMPIIIPSATEADNYIVEWTGYNGSDFRVRSLKDFSYDAIDADDLSDGYMLVYNKSGTKFTLMSWSYDNGFSVTLKNVLDGTSSTVNVITASNIFTDGLPKAYYDAEDKLRWSIFVIDFSDAQPTETEGIIISPAWNSVKIYEYQDTELVNTVDYLAIRDSLVDEAKTILYDSANISIADELLYEIAVESHYFKINSGASSAGNIVVTIDGSAYSVPVTAGMTASNVANAIANKTYSGGWAGDAWGGTYVSIARSVADYDSHTDVEVSINTGSTGVACQAVEPAHPNGITQTSTYEMADKVCSMNYPGQLTPELKDLWGKEVYLGFSSGSFSFVADRVTTTDGVEDRMKTYFGNGSFAYTVSAKGESVTPVIKKFVASSSTQTNTFSDIFVNSSAPYTTKNIIHNITVSTAALNINIDTKATYEATQTKTMPNGFKVLWDKTASTLTLSDADWSMDITELVNSASLDSVYIVERFDACVLLDTDKALYIIDRLTNNIVKSAAGLYFSNQNCPVITGDKNKIINTLMASITTT